MQPELFPLSELEEVKNPRPSVEFHFLVFTSPAAVETASRLTAELPKDLPTFAVGTGTADQLRSQTYSDVRIGDGDARSLAKLVVAQKMSGLKSGLYVCGEERSFDFVSPLEQAGIELHLWEIYRTRDLNPAKTALETALDKVFSGIVLLYSPANSVRFFDLVA